MRTDYYYHIAFDMYNDFYLVNAVARAVAKTIAKAVFEIRMSIN